MGTSSSSADNVLAEPIPRRPDTRNLAPAKPHGTLPHRPAATRVVWIARHTVHTAPSATSTSDNLREKNYCEIKQPNTTRVHKTGGKALAGSCGTRSPSQCPQHRGDKTFIHRGDSVAGPVSVTRCKVLDGTRHSRIQKKGEHAITAEQQKQSPAGLLMRALYGCVSYWCGTAARPEAPAAARLLRPAMKATTATTAAAPVPTPTHPHAGNPPETEDDTPDLPPEETVGSLTEVEFCGVRSPLAETMEPPRERKSRLSIVTFRPLIFPWVDLMIFPGIVITIRVLKPLESPLLLR